MRWAIPPTHEGGVKRDRVCWAGVAQVWRHDRTQMHEDVFVQSAGHVEFTRATSFLHSWFRVPLEKCSVRSLNLRVNIDDRMVLVNLLASGSSRRAQDRHSKISPSTKLERTC